MTHGVRVLTVDLETWGGAVKPTRDDISIPGNYKNEKTIEDYITRELPAAHNNQAKNSLRGELACIGLAMDDEPVEVLYRSGSEEELMKQFDTWLRDKGVNDLTQVYWVGGGIDFFDLPWLLHRSWKYDLPLVAGLIPDKKYDEHIVDILRIFAGTDTQAKHSVDRVAKFLGLEGKVGMTGKDVPQAYLDGKHEEIASYCANDVTVERKIAKIIAPWIWQ